MRNLESADLFKALRVVKNTGIKESLKPVLRSAAEGKADIVNIGIDGVLTVIGVFAENGIEKQMYDFLSGPFEMKPEDVEHLDILVLYDKIQWLIEEGNLKAFLQRLSGLITTK